MGKILSFLSGFGRQSRTGLVALRTEGKKVSYAHGAASGSGKPVVISCGEAEWRGDAASLARAYREFGFGSNTRCATLLAAGDYQISAVEAPNVPEAELKAALRGLI